MIGIFSFFQRLVVDVQYWNGSMKIGRYIVGVLGFLLIWLFVAVIIGIVMITIFPPGRHAIAVGIGLNWRNIPGTVLGILAGRQSFRASVRGRKKRGG